MTLTGVAASGIWTDQDVTAGHCPSLGVGPIQVYPGHVEEVVVTAKMAGVHPYYCTSVCGMPHFGMRGQFERGRWLSPKKGCIACYGVAEPPVPRYNVVVAQYQAVRDVIRNGSVAGKKDPKGAAPPLEMPSWSSQLSSRDIDSPDHTGAQGQAGLEEER